MERTLKDWQDTASPDSEVGGMVFYHHFSGEWQVISLFALRFVQVALEVSSIWSQEKWCGDERHVCVTLDRFGHVFVMLVKLILSRQANIDFMCSWGGPSCWCHARVCDKAETGSHWIWLKSIVKAGRSWKWNATKMELDA